MTLLANIIGIAAVAMFVFSYQLKTRRTLIFFNAGSRVLYAHLGGVPAINAYSFLYRNG